MTFRFRRSFKILPGVRINLGKRGVSTSIGVRGARLTFGADGKKRTTVGVPGTGLSYTTTESAEAAHTEPAGSALRGFVWIALICLMLWLVF